MLRDFRARSFSYDPRSDEARIEVGPAGGQVRTIRGLLLLDARGFLVGVDLGGEALDRAVVLLGPYESVDRTVEAEVSVAYGASGEPVEVRVRRAKAAVRGGEPNPYAAG